MRALLVAALILVGSCAWAQPPNRPSQYGSTEAEKALARERDQDGDHIADNFRGTVGTPTPSDAGRCVTQCVGATPALALSNNGGPFQKFLSSASGNCECPGVGTDTTCVGVNASCASTDAACVGKNAACGQDAACLGFGCIAVTNGVCVGESCSASTNGTAIGALAGANAACTALGEGTICGAQDAVFGSSTAPITHVYFGNGKTNTSPTTTTITGTGGIGTNIGGGFVAIEGGASTGSTAGGVVEFLVHPSGAPGATPNTTTTGWEILPNTNAAFVPSAASDIGTVMAPIGNLYATSVFDAALTSAGHVVCADANGELGQCTNAPDSGGACTCVSLATRTATPTTTRTATPTPTPT